MFTRRTFLVSAALLPMAGPALAKAPVVCAQHGAAINGYDPVAYFTEGAARRGLSDHRVMWRGAVWFFTREANREAFERTPRAFAPRYGGYCAYAMSNGFTATGDPELWRIHDSRLYLVHNAQILTKWLADIPGHVEKADANWPSILGK